MKTHFLLLTIGLLMTFGCKKLNSKKELRIDIGTQFQNDFVVIKLDNKQIFSDSVTTNNTIGNSKILTFDYPTGSYDISVMINGIEKSDKFRHKKNRYILISFNKSSSEITISYPKEKYEYD